MKVPVSAIIIEVKWSRTRKVVFLWVTCKYVFTQTRHQAQDVTQSQLDTLPRRKKQVCPTIYPELVG